MSKVTIKLRGGYIYHVKDHKAHGLYIRLHRALNKYRFCADQKIANQQPKIIEEIKKQLKEHFETNLYYGNKTNEFLE